MQKTKGPTIKKEPIINEAALKGTLKNDTSQYNIKNAIKNISIS
jgi:hypothetical protein